MPQKSGFVSIVGRPSAGKSTLLNKLCGYKIAITSPIPQTTRNKIRGIFNSELGQIVFVDTPGYHNSDKKMNLHLKNLSKSSLEDVDLILYVIDSTKALGKEEEEIVQQLKNHESELIVAINKVDSSLSKHKELLNELHKKLNPLAFHMCSALSGQGLDVLIQTVFDNLEEAMPMYPQDYYTDQDPQFRIAEIIREKAIIDTKQELPHSLYVHIADMEENIDENTLWVRAFIMLERESQKGIIVGKGGQNIRRIRVSAQRDLRKIFPQKVTLDLRVKVDHKWRKKDTLLNKLIY